MTKGTNAAGVTGAITLLANAIACDLSIDELALVAGLFVQLGDTLASIAAYENLCGEKNNEVT